MLCKFSILAFALCLLAGCAAPLSQATASPPATLTPVPATATPEALPIEWLRIQKYPGNYTCFKLETSTGVVIVTDPFGMDEDVQADIVTVSHHHDDHADFSRLTGDYRLIDTTGDFDEKGVRITGVAGHHNKGDTTTTNIIYVFGFGGIRLAQFASQGEMPTREMFAKIGKVDIVIIQIYGQEYAKLSMSEAYGITHRVQAKIMIPAHNNARILTPSFGAEYGSHPEGLLVVTNNDLVSQQSFKIVVLDVPEA